MRSTFDFTASYADKVLLEAEERHGQQLRYGRPARPAGWLSPFK
jgi:hypothetical protein